MIALLLPALLLATGDARDDGVAILTLDQARADATAAGDEPALRRILDARFVLTRDADPASIDKDEFTDWATTHRRPAGDRADLSDRSLRLEDGVAILLETEAIGGEQARLTMVYIRRADGWHALAEHRVTIPAP